MAPFKLQQRRSEAIEFLIKAEKQKMTADKLFESIPSETVERSLIANQSRALFYLIRALKMRISLYEMLIEQERKSKS